MDINDLTIGQGKELAAMFGGEVMPSVQNSKHPYSGRRVLIRTYAAGVHFGTLGEFKPGDNTAFLVDTQRIYHWSGAFTLSAVALNGIKSGKVSEILEEIFLTQVIEIILLSEEAQKSFKSVGIHKP